MQSAQFLSKHLWLHIIIQITNYQHHKRESTLHTVTVIQLQQGYSY